MQNNQEPANYDDYQLPAVDASVPEFDTFGRFGRPVKPGCHEALIADAKIGPAKSSGKVQVTLTWLIDGDETACPEGPVKVDQYIAVPPEAQWSYRNFRDELLPGTHALTGAAVKTLVGKRRRVLTDMRKATAEVRDPLDQRIVLKKAFPATPEVRKILPSKAGLPDAKAEADPFEVGG